MMSFDGKVTAALIVALFLETASAFVWVGGAAARLSEVERSIEAQREVSERLARVETQLIDARQSLARIESRLEQE